MDFRIIAVSEILPLKQGLKPTLPGDVKQPKYGLRDTSIKTRIETLILGL